jgi:hypothetical protein
MAVNSRVGQFLAKLPNKVYDIVGNIMNMNHLMHRRGAILVVILNSLIYLKFLKLRNLAE